MGYSIQDAIDEADRWMEINGIESVAEGKKDGKECVLVYSSLSPSELFAKIPRNLRGFPVVFEDSGGEFFAQHNMQNKR